MDQITPHGKIRLSYLFKKKKKWDLVIGTKVSPTTITSPDGTVPDPPRIGNGSIKDWENKNQTAQMIIVDGVKNSCLGHTTSGEAAHKNWTELQRIQIKT